MPKFHVSCPGSLHSHVLYNRDGDYVYTLSNAIAVAEDVYGDEWCEVYNGLEGADRE